MNVSVGTGNDAASSSVLGLEGRTNPGGESFFDQFVRQSSETQYLSALISCIKVTRPNADAGHDMGYFRNATRYGKVGQVELWSIRLAMVVPSFLPSFSGVTPNEYRASSASAECEWCGIVPKCMGWSSTYIILALSKSTGSGRQQIQPGRG
jgi:hypothetical protein